ncbi:cation:proton antiporter [Spongisporangium articulatum]|uniref:Cation:proton antiporter n=1 Tax=Spongisporangium articulatum TaxID=3362603 RepID=A0ABW8AM58_9ACTN
MNGVQVLLIAAAGVVVAAFAKRRGVQSGMVIVLLATAAGFIPGMPRLVLDGELILALVVPPLLYSAARGAYVTGLGQNLRPIFTLGVTLVVLTAGALGLVSSWLLPGIGLAAALTLGTVLAPPDTATIVAGAREFGMPRRVVSILTGESLVNDATALTLFSIAVAATEGDRTGIGSGVGRFAYNAGIGILIGAVLVTVTLLIRPHLGDPTLETTFVLLVPFTGFLAAEQLHASGILAVVVAALGITVNVALDPNHEYAGAYRTRLREANLWPVLDFLLETFVFAYIGLQLRFVLEDLRDADSGPGLGRTLVAAGVLLVVAIVFRMAYVSGVFGWWGLRHRAVERRLERDPALRARLDARYRERAERRFRRGTPAEDGRDLPAPVRRDGSWPQPWQVPPTAKETVVVGWTGMRGILTLAAAAAVPELTSEGEPFPGRDAIAAIALIVTLGTLLVQGTTLPRLIRRLRFDTAADDAEDARMRARARELVAGAVEHAEPFSDEEFDAQRHAVETGLVLGEIDEETARRAVQDLDLRQAAARTL